MGVFFDSTTCQYRCFNIMRIGLSSHDVVLLAQDIRIMMDLCHISHSFINTRKFFVLFD